MQGPNALLNVLTIPPGATSGARIVLDGTRGAIFIYNAANQLVGSWSGTAGNDGLGNNYPADFMVQDIPHARQIQLALYFIQLMSINPSTLLSNGATIQLIDATATNQAPVGAFGGPQVGTQDFAEILCFGESSDASQKAHTHILRSASTGTISTPGTAALEAVDSHTGGPFDAFAVFQGGISFYPLKIDTAGKISWGSGTAAVDSNLYRLGVNSLKTDGSLTVGNTLTSSLYETAASNPSMQIDSARDALFGYTSTNDLVVAASPVGGTDFFGHSFPIGFAGINIPITTLTTGTQTFTLASAVAITGLTASLVVGTYDVEFECYWVPAGTIGSNHTHAFAFTGTASSAQFNGTAWQAQAANAVSQNTNFVSSTAFPVSWGNSPVHVAFNGWTRITCRIVVTAAGTLTPTIALVTAGDNVITQPGSRMVVTRVA